MLFKKSPFEIQPVYTCDSGIHVMKNAVPPNVEGHSVLSIRVEQLEKDKAALENELFHLKLKLEALLSLQEEEVKQACKDKVQKELQEEDKHLAHIRTSFSDYPNRRICKGN